MSKIARILEKRNEIYAQNVLVYREVGRIALMRLSDEDYTDIAESVISGDNGTFLERVKAGDRVKEIMERIEGTERLPTISYKDLPKAAKEKAIRGRVKEAVKNSKKETK